MSLRQNGKKQKSKCQLQVHLSLWIRRESMSTAPCAGLSKHDVPTGRHRADFPSVTGRAGFCFHPRGWIGRDHFQFSGLEHVGEKKHSSKLKKKKFSCLFSFFIIYLLWCLFFQCICFCNIYAHMRAFCTTSLHKRRFLLSEWRVNGYRVHEGNDLGLD